MEAAKDTRYVDILLYGIAIQAICAAALAVFPVVAVLAIKFQSASLFLPGGGTILDGHCPAIIPDKGHTDVQFPNRLHYTGVGLLDYLLCFPVAASGVQGFLAEPVTTQFTHYFFSSLLPILSILAVEGLRPGVSKAASLPYFILFLSQFGSLGVILPVYWTLYIFGGNVDNRRNVSISDVGRNKALAASFGLIIGAVLPSLGMLHFKDPYTIATWLLYPIFVAILHYCTFKVLPASAGLKSAFPVIRSLYIGTFVFASSTHIAAVWPKVPRLSWPEAFAPPALDPSYLSISTIPFLLQNCLKWDFFFAMLSCVLASLWFARNVKELLGFILWYFLAIPVFGIGSAVMGVFIYDDAIL